MQFEDCGMFDQIFTFVAEDSVAVSHWNVTAALRYILAAGMPSFKQIGVDYKWVAITTEQAAFVAAHNGVEQERIDYLIATSNVNTPILIVAHEGGKCTILDGNHRYVASYLIGRDRIPAMLVTREFMRPFEIEGIPDEISKHLVDTTVSQKGTQQ